MKTQINIKVDMKVKKVAQKKAEKLGLSLSSVINANLTQFAKSGELNLSTELRPNARLRKELRLAMEDFRNGRNLAGPFKTGKEMDDYLNSQ